MSILAFQIAKTGNIPFPTPASTLDELTRELPQGFYTTFSTLFNATKAMGLHRHLQRLYAPARERNLVPSVDERTLRSCLAEIVKINLPHESRARLILAKDTGKIYVGVQEFVPLPENVYQNGAHVVSASVARHDPRVKDTSFIVESATQRKLLSADVFEVLLTKNGKILEGMTSNFYAVKGNTLVTARRGILLGVTRRAILRLARGEGAPIEYRAPRLNEKFDEAFLTSSSRGVVAITFIDGIAVGEGRVGKRTIALAQAYQTYVEKKSETINLPL